MAGLIERHGPCSLLDSPYQPFHTLAISIISQQLSAKVTNIIVGRIAHLSALPLHPLDIARISAEELRNTGISSRKVSYLQSLANTFLKQQLLFDRLIYADDEEVIAKLMKLPGIGRWTAEMFLIFGLKRANVLALTDSGLQRAVRMLYGNTENLAGLGLRWQPYNSVASWYLWRHLDEGNQ